MCSLSVHRPIMQIIVAILCVQNLPDSKCFRLKGQGSVWFGTGDGIDWKEVTLPHCSFESPALPAVIDSQEKDPIEATAPCMMSFE